MSERRTGPGQLDLFLHSGAVMLANDVVDALVARDGGRALDSLQRLRAEDADYREIGDLETLCGALDAWPFPASDAAEVAQAVRKLEHTVDPTARRAMGRRSPDFMRPLWSELANAVRALPYDPAWPSAHYAGLLIRAGEYKAAEKAAASIPQAEHQPDALHWLAVARYRVHGLEASRPALFRLALLAPERVAAVIDEIGDTTLRKDWENFFAECIWLDPKDPAAPKWFPAWSLLEHPGMRIAADAPAPDGTPSGDAFALLSRLLELEACGYSRALVAARSRLRDLAPDLFERFMARRRSSAF